MSDDQGGGDEPPQPPQGRWLGAVRSWVGASVPDSEESKGMPEAAAASAPALSADEIRRRRLERMEGATNRQVREASLLLVQCTAAEQ